MLEVLGAGPVCMRVNTAGPRKEQLRSWFRTGRRAQGSERLGTAPVRRAASKAARDLRTPGRGRLERAKDSRSERCSERAHRGTGSHLSQSRLPTLSRRALPQFQRPRPPPADPWRPEGQLPPHGQQRRRQQRAGTRSGCRRLLSPVHWPVQGVRDALERAEHAECDESSDPGPQ